MRRALVLMGAALLAVACGELEAPKEEPFVPADGNGDGNDANGGASTGSNKPPADCKTNETKCGGECVDLSSSTLHCGACDGACEGAETCASAECICPATAAMCSDACVDPQTDAKNCGGCGQACESWQVCSAGQCACAAGTVECGDACVDFSSDDAHCGACDRACPGNATCTSSECACNDPALLACGTLCIDPLTSGSHCGHCGNACDVSENCTTGVCLPTTATVDNQCIAIRSGGQDYSFCAAMKSWSNARSACQSWGMDLVIIGSELENTFVFSNMPVQSWIGANDGGGNNQCSASTTLGDEGAWAWAAPLGADDGNLFCVGVNNASNTSPCVPIGTAFVGFGVNQPDNSGCGSGNTGEDCAEINPDGVWNDNRCSVSTNGFVCESY